MMPLPFNTIIRAVITKLKKYSAIFRIELEKEMHSVRPIRDLTTDDFIVVDTQAVNPTILSKDRIIKSLNLYKYGELTNAKLLCHSRRSLTVGDVYLVWQSILNAIECHKGSPVQSLKSLAVECEKVVNHAFYEQSKTPAKDSVRIATIEVPARQSFFKRVTSLLSRIDV